MKFPNGFKRLLDRRALPRIGPEFANPMLLIIETVILEVLSLDLVFAFIFRFWSVYHMIFGYLHITSRFPPLNFSENENLILANLFDRPYERSALFSLLALFIGFSNWDYILIYFNLSVEVLEKNNFWFCKFWRKNWGCIVQNSCQILC